MPTSIPHKMLELSNDPVQPVEQQQQEKIVAYFMGFLVQLYFSLISL